jgi:hypothetical protein
MKIFMVLSLRNFRLQNNPKAINALAPIYHCRQPMQFTLSPAGQSRGHM